MRFNKVPSLKTPGVDPGGWNPGMTSTAPTCWLDANYGITKDTSNRVAAWASRVGSVSFTQSTDGNKPVWTVNSINGLPALVFDGTGAVMTSTATLGNLITNAASTIYFVARATKKATNSILMYDTQGQYHSSMGTTNTFKNVGYDGGSKVTEAAWADNVLRAWELRHEGGNNYLTNRKEADPAAVALGNIANMTGTIVLGGVNTTTQLFLGSVAELITYNTALSADERSQVYNYLARKWLGT
jgi:hypothetical protein